MHCFSGIYYFLFRNISVQGDTGLFFFYYYYGIGDYNDKAKETEIKNQNYSIFQFLPQIFRYVTKIDGKDFM